MTSLSVRFIRTCEVEEIRTKSRFGELTSEPTSALTKTAASADSDLQLVQRCRNTKVPYILKEEKTAECKTFLVPYDDYLREFINSKAGKPASPHLESTMHKKI